MKNLTRRQLLKMGGVAAAGLAAGPGLISQRSFSAKPARNGESKIPLIHVTDLYHPPQDPDDLLDLATVMALEEFELMGVVLDITGKFLVAAPAGFDIPRDPGFVPVVQLAYLTGRAVPVAMGPNAPLTSAGDSAADRPLREQAGISMVLDILARSPRKVVISCVGSARVVAAAFNRDPELLREKVSCVLLNAGSTGGEKVEWNVGLDPAAYISLWRSGLPIRWYPPSTETGAFDPANERGTYWTAPHSVLFKDLPDPMRAWVSFNFSGSMRGDIIRALSETGKGSVWQDLLEAKRNMWSTASLVMAAGRVLAHTPEGWRFVPASKADGFQLWQWRLDHIDANVSDDARVSWKVVESGGNAMLFGRRGGTEYGMAMAEAFNALLKSIPL